jgi:putative serine protease PepD
VDGEDQWASGQDPGDDSGDEVEPDRMLGWISPDDRLWRHPSESTGPATGSSTVVIGPNRPSTRSRSGPWIVGGTACIVLVLVVAGVVMVTTGTAEQDGPGAPTSPVTLTAAPTTEPGGGHPVTMASLAPMMSAIRPSTVMMTIERSSGTTVTTGLVAVAAGFIVTTWEALSGARSITVIEPGGSRQVATLVGVDQPSGLAVVRIGDDLPAAKFDNGDPPSGTGAVAMALEPGRPTHGGPTPVVYAGTVLSAGQAVDADAVTSTFAATAIRAPLSHDDLGCPLVNAAGHVSGMLEKTVQDGASTISVFLPAGLVLGVAQQLVSSGAVIHGSLGVDASDADLTTTTSTYVSAASTPAAGARLDSVDAGGPAALKGMQSGDIITAIDDYPVRSSAELTTRLYPDRPGTQVQVTLNRGGTPTTMAVTLAAADPDAQGSNASP